MAGFDYPISRHVRIRYEAEVSVLVGVELDILIVAIGSEQRRVNVPPVSRTIVVGVAAASELL